jgi:hypothetical protein
VPIELSVDLFNPTTHPDMCLHVATSSAYWVWQPGSDIYADPMKTLSTERVPEPFRNRARDLRILVRVLNDYLRDADVNVPGTAAADDLAAQVDFADDDIADPVLHVQVRAHHGLIAAIDHLGGVAACIDAQDVALATMSLLRPTVVAAGISYWVLEPDIGVRERLRRGWNLELDSVREQLNSIDKNATPEFWQQTTVVRHRYLRWGDAHRFTRQQRKRYGERRYWFGDGQQTSSPPSEIKLAEGVLTSVGAGEVGRQAYRFTSAFVHAQPHAFTSFLPAHTQHDPQVPNVVPLGVSIDDLTTWLLVVVLAVHTSATRCGVYFGWDLDRWNGTVFPILHGWQNDLAG